jgi:mannose-6-phosphate isomerase
MHPIRLESSLHETIWGGRRFERDGWKQLPPGNVLIGEAWETETNTIAQNQPYRGKTLGTLVEEFGEALLGERAVAIFGRRFPLLAKFIDANAKLSVQVHPDDGYAARHEQGQPGKTECWYILDAAPGASITHGFRASTSRAIVQRAIETVTLENLLEEVPVSPGDVIFVPAGTVHAIGGGVLLYELQEYSDLTYRMYDYGRLTAAGTPRELHIERSLDVARYERSPRVKVQPVALPGGPGYSERCLVACRYFVLCELALGQPGGELDIYPRADSTSSPHGSMKGETGQSCVILTSLGASLRVCYGASCERSEMLARGQTMVLPAALGEYRLEGQGKLLYAYVPAPGDEAWEMWMADRANTIVG